MNRRSEIDNLRRLLQGPLPGHRAHRKMFNYERPPATVASRIDPHLRKSAVLMLLYPYNNQWYTVLMLRPTYPGTHSGQVSFPGGRREKIDNTASDNALREAYEELRIPPTQVEIVGELSPIYIPPSHFLVQPVVGFMVERPEFIPDNKEVAAVIETPITVFDDDESLFETRIYISERDVHIDARAFRVNGYTVWGATAMIFSEWREIAGQWSRQD